MKIARYLVVLALICLWMVPLAARADDATPVPQVTAPAEVVEPTPPPIVEDTPVPPDTTGDQTGEPSVESTPVSVTQERTNPVVQVQQSTNPVSTPEPAAQATDSPSAGTQTEQSVTPGFTQPASGSTPSSVSVPQPQDVAPPESVQQVPDTTTNPDVGVTTDVTEPTSAQAPAQLKCSGKPHPDGAPFLVAPFSGWMEIVSYVDHDGPDYSVDGKIVLANGLTASASDGQASDLFPSYWSPSLRQYVNYDGHNGYDFDLNYQPVLAAAGGTVEYAGWNSSDEYAGYGQMVLIRHRDGYATLYGHLSKLEVQTGDRVEAGQEIGISGTTGHSSGPHLHFSVFHDCQVTDPYGWTGHGPDPLYAFNGQQSQYLWLPGNDPLVLNPPPQWPTFPLGLKVPIPRDEVSIGARRVPPVDRLLLLALPVASHGRFFSPAVALARTEAAIAQEASALTPQLDELTARHLVESYQVIPAAGAVWVRGTASADTLEGLAGVASITGVRPRDLTAAEQGLAHGVLVQIGRQQVPSLWPVGFRSALQASRPIVSVLQAHSLVAGFTLPGQRVLVTLERGDTAPGAAATTADPQTGGFVATIHDSGGNPVAVQVGDSVEVESAGRTSVVHVAPLELRARSHLVRVQAPPQSSVSLASAMTDRDTPGWRVTLGSSRAGTISLRPKQPMYAGAMVVASTVDTAGNQEAVASCVPGVVLIEGSSIVRGWAVGKSPTVDVFRHGRPVISVPVHPSEDESFSVQLGASGHAVQLRAGDRVQIGSRWHHRAVIVPALRVSLATGSEQLGLLGPAHARLHVTLATREGDSRDLDVTVGRHGSADVHLPTEAQSGDAVTVSYQMPSGDTLATMGVARGIVIREGTPHVSGEANPDGGIVLEVKDARGQVVGAARARPRPGAGGFTATIRSIHRAAVAIPAGAVVTVSDQSGRSTVRVPLLDLKADTAHHEVFVRSEDGSDATLLLRFGGGKARTMHLSATSSTGRTIRLSRSEMSAVRSILVRVSPSPGVTVERLLSLKQMKRGKP